MENVCVVCLDPRGSQDLSIDDLQMGKEWGTYLYLVHTNLDTLEVEIDMEWIAENYDRDTGDEGYCQLFETKLSEAGIVFSRLPDQCFGIYSTLI
jgi:hypothetical protein